MKNKIKLFEIVALVALIGFSFAACSNDDGGTSYDDFQGKWVELEAIAEGGFSEYSYEFDGNKMTFRTIYGPPNSTDRNEWPGTFTFTDTEITFIPEQAGTWQGYTATYKFEGKNKLYMSASIHPDGLFTKQ